MRTFTKLLKTELKLNIRNMNMVIFAIIMPIVVLVVLGFIYQAKPAFEGAGYTFLEQSMSAVCTISICACGLMGLPLVVSGYREFRISRSSTPSGEENAPFISLYTTPFKVKGASSDSSS